MTADACPQRPLLRAFPRLAAALPWTDLGAEPTPVLAMERLGPELAGLEVWVKRDDLLGSGHGGNKVRKLEFLLGDALRRGAREVMTFGFAGSNHATCTAWYARSLGLRSISMLLPQANGASLRRNLLLSHACGAELHERPNIAALRRTAYVQLARHTLRSGRMPMTIPAGGSAPLGIAGFVNAAFELRDQIAAGALPKPKRIYLAAGSMGSVCGLALGLAAAGTAIPIEAVRVTPRDMADMGKLAALFAKTAALLRRGDPSFPDVSFDDCPIHWREEFFGSGYGVPSPEGTHGAALLAEHGGPPLDGTYSAKAMAALVHDAQSGVRDGGPVLFWATCNSKDVYGETAKIDYRALPRAFHRYFTETV